MIVVSVFLLSAVNGETSELARMTIDNIGGDVRRGDYRTRTLRGRSQEALHRAMIRGTVQREGQVLNHARQQEHVWNLVAKALTGMAYGGKGADAPGEANYLAHRAATNNHAESTEGTPDALASCAHMLEEYGADCFPANEAGQVHFARVIMDVTAAEIRAYLASLASRGESEAG